MSSLPILRSLLARNRTTRVLFLRSYSSLMEEAKKRVALLKEDPGNDVKLKLYALFKQATIGKCNTAKPGVFDFVGQAKWNAWNDLGAIPQTEAEKQYVALVDSLAGGIQDSPVKHEEGVQKGIEGMEITRESGVCTLKFNRPKKLNAITLEMYNCIRDTLNEVADDPSVKVAVITGAGDFFCSGNDLSNFTKLPPGGPKQLAVDSRLVLKSFIESFINFPKLLVFAVNGPAIGISVTTMALADLVYAAEDATFHTPFMTLGQSPEGCSSYTFPKIMGYARANEVLIGGRKLSAQEAFDRGLVTDVIPRAEFQNFVTEKMKYLSELPPKSVMYSKALNRLREKDTLLRVNEEECARLEERWLSDECMNAVMKFLSNKSKI